MAASIENVTISPLLDTIDVLNQTNTTLKEPFVASTYGMLLSYSFLLLAALLCVYFGSYRSIIRKEKQKNSGEKPDILTAKDAAMFPFIASGFLFGIYLVILFVAKEYITFVLNIYFFLIGIVALYRAIDPLLIKIRLPFFDKLRERQFHVKLSESQPSKEAAATTTSTMINNIMHLDFKFDLVDVIALFFCILIGVWYLLKRHWIANNLFGIAFSLNAIEILHFNKVLNGCVLLGGLFIYDIFWVFGTNVMVTVAKSFDAPIKLIFPQDLIENGLLGANKFAMLGLGDIVVPGAFIALMLRYDMSRRPSSKLYFNVSFVAYVIALVVTILILQLFKHAQPALLYIVPLCVSFPLITALICKDWTTMFAYEDHASPEEIVEKKKK